MGVKGTRHRPKAVRDAERAAVPADPTKGRFVCGAWIPGQPKPLLTTAERVNVVLKKYQTVGAPGTLLGDLGIDSLKMLELVVDLEGEFHLGLDFERLYRDPPREELGEMVWRQVTVEQLTQIIDRTIQESGDQL